MKYLLFLYPCDKTWDPEINNLDIAEELMPIVKSDDIKFVFGDNHTIFHFDSDMCQPELAIFLDLVKENQPADFMYFLVQNTKEVSSNMVPEHLDHLMTIKKKRGRKPKNPIKNIFIHKIPGTHTGKNYQDLHNETNLFYQNNVCDLTLDEILDKIVDQGMDSLSRVEKDKLDQYSKEK
jgi:hypothetical protein